MTDRASPLADFIAGADSPEAIEALRAALRRWCASDGSIPLTRYLGLRMPAEFRRGERDRWLRAARRHVRDCHELAAAVRGFESRCWPLWRHAAIAPACASEISAALFYARRASREPLPESAKHLRRIVDRDTESVKLVPAIAA